MLYVFEAARVPKQLKQKGKLKMKKYSKLCVIAFVVVLGLPGCLCKSKKAPEEKCAKCEVVPAKP